MLFYIRHPIHTVRRAIKGLILLNRCPTLVFEPCSDLPGPPAVPDATAGSIVWRAMWKSGLGTVLGYIALALISLAVVAVAWAILAVVQ